MKKIIWGSIIFSFLVQVISAKIILKKIPLTVYFQNSTIEIEWINPGNVCRLEYTQISGDFSDESKKINQISPGKISFIPKDLIPPLTTGIYYARIVEENNVTNVSMQFSIYIDSDTYPNLILPQNNAVVQNEPLIFKWSEIPGVPYYHIIVSNTPIKIVWNPQTKKFEFEGLSPIWQAITSSCQIAYKDLDPSGWYENINTPVLVKGQTYNWLVLNNFNNTPTTTNIKKTLLPPIGSFTVDLANSLPSIKLISPVNEALIETDSITFDWNDISNADKYHLYLYLGLETKEETTVTQILVWDIETTLSSVTLYPANTILSNYKYFWKVIAEASDFNPSTSLLQSFTYKRGETGEITIEVKDEDYAIPISRANLKINLKETDATIFEFTVDDTGKIKDVKLPIKNYTITGIKEEFESKTQDLPIAPGQNSFTLLLKRNTSSVWAKVKDNKGNAIKGAVVNFTNLISKEQKRIVTDSLGYFIAFLEPATWAIAVTKPGYSKGNQEQKINESGIDIKLEDFILTENKATIYGTVEDELDRVVAGAKVTAKKNEIKYETITDILGKYFFEVEAGTWQLEAFKTGYISDKPVNVVVNQKDNVYQKLKLQSAAFITGVTLNEQNQPIPKVNIKAIPEIGLTKELFSKNTGDYLLNIHGDVYYTISAFHQDYICLTPPYKQIKLSPGEALSGINFVLTKKTGVIKGKVTDGIKPLDNTVIVINYQETNTKTDVNGEYQITVPTGEIIIDVKKEGYFNVTGVRQLYMLPNEIKENIDFVMQPNASKIKGKTILFPSEEPIPKVKVIAKSDKIQKETISSNNGEYEFDVSTGNWELIATKSLFAQKEPIPLIITVKPGEIKEQNIFMEKNSAIIKGWVKNEKEEVLSGALVECLENYNNTYTDNKGNYSLEVPPGGPYSFRASLLPEYGYTKYHESLVLQKDEIRSNINFILSNLNLKGHVKDSQTSLPIASATVKIEGLIECTTTQDGNYGVKIDPPGDYTVTASHKFYTPQVKNCKIILNQTTTLNFELQRAQAKLFGQVVDENNQPLKDVKIKTEGTVDNGSTSTNNDGNYELNLKTGVYSLIVSKDGYASKKIDNIELIFPQTKVEQIKLYQLTNLYSLTGKITVDGINPIKEVKVNLKALNYIPNAVFTDSEGKFNFFNLPKDTYTLSGIKKVFLSPYKYEEYLFPSNVTIEITKNTNIEIILPITHQRKIEDIRTLEDDIIIEVKVANNNVTFSEFNLIYYYAGEQKQEILMERKENIYKAIVTKTQLKKKNLYYQIKAKLSNPITTYNEYESPIYTITITDVLKEVFLEPNSIVLLKNKTKLVQVKGKNNEGREVEIVDSQIEWKIIEGKEVIEYTLSTEKPTTVEIKGLKKGKAKLQVKVKKDIDYVAEAFIIVTELNKIQINCLTSLSLKEKIDNSFQKVEFDALGLDSENRIVEITPQWSITPTIAGKISSTGVFIPKNSYIGEINIKVKDKNTPEIESKWPSNKGFIYQTIFPDSLEITCGNDKIELVFPANCVKQETNIWVENVILSLEEQKSENYRILLEEAYDFSVNGSKEFIKPITLKIVIPPEDESISSIYIGKYENLKWIVFENSQIEENKVKAVVSSLSKFTLLIKQLKELSIEEISLLPNPFSDKTGINIKYKVYSKNIPYITIKIYNMGGYLIKTLKENQRAKVGMFEEVKWDGKDEKNQLVCNGRYVVQFLVQDITKKKKILKTVVFWK